jgi:hypothetical protein
MLHFQDKRENNMTAHKQAQEAYHLSNLDTAHKFAYDQSMMHQDALLKLLFSDL